MPRPASSLSTEAQALRSYHQRLSRLLDDAIAFWVDAVDWDQGGFLGAIDADGKPIMSAHKHLVQQTRHLWAFANIHRFEASQDRPIAEICHRQYEFIRDKFYLPASESFLKTVTAEGQPVERGADH